MALIEVDENEAQAGAAAKLLLDKVANNPETRKGLLKLIKQINPNASIPELDTAAPILSEMEAMRKAYDEKMAALEAKLAQKEDVDNFTKEVEKHRNKLRREGWTDEGIAEVEKVMETRGFVDYDAAAALVEKQRPKEEPVAKDGVDFAFGDLGWRPPKASEQDDARALLFSDRSGDAFMKREVGAFLQERKRAGR